MKSNKVNYQRETELLILSVFLTYLASNCFGLIGIDMGVWPVRFAECGVYILMLIPSLVCYVIQNGKSEISFFKIKIKHCLLGLVCGLTMAGLWKLIDYVFDFKAVGMAVTKSVWSIIYYFFFYIFIVGIIEEFIFRIYIQGTLTKILGKYAILAPFFSAVLFGLYHLTNRSFFNMVLTFILGLIWGYIRYFWKNCSYGFLIFIHGMYDYGIHLMACLTYALLVMSVS